MSTTRAISSGDAGAVALRPMRTPVRSAAATSGSSTSFAHCAGTAATTVMRSRTSTSSIDGALHGAGASTIVTPIASCSQSLAMKPAWAMGSPLIRRSNATVIAPAAGTAAASPRWSNQAPLGMPVVPLVQMMQTGSERLEARTEAWPRPGLRGDELGEGEPGQPGCAVRNHGVVGGDEEAGPATAEDRPHLTRAEARVDPGRHGAEAHHRGVRDRVVDRPVEPRARPRRPGPRPGRPAPWPRRRPTRIHSANVTRRSPST